MNFAYLYTRFFCTLLFYCLSITIAYANFTIDCTPTTPASNSTISNGAVSIQLTSSQTSGGNNILTIRDNMGQTIASQVINNFPAVLEFNNLKGGTYTGTISDGINTESCSFIIGVASCNLSVENSPVSNVLNCSTDTAPISAIPTGGIPPYTYQWTENRSGQTINVGTGIWTVTVTDNAGCTAMAQTVQTSPPPFIVTCDSPTPASNTNTADGVININISGGQAPYSVSINALNGQDIPNINQPQAGTINLTGYSSGKYFINIVDEFGCMASCETTVGVQNCNLEVILPTIDLECNNSSTMLTPIVSGGLPPYQYLWNNNSEQSSIVVDRSSMPSVTVTDQTGCMRTQTGNINVPQLLQVFCSNIQDATTTGVADGSVDFVINGGTLPYSFSVTRSGVSYENGAIPLGVDNFTLSSFLEGSYLVLISDNNNCTAQCQFSINEPMCDLSVNLPDVRLDCKGDADGVLQPQISGGMPPYRYLWGRGQSSNTLGNLSIGTYFLSVTDANNCRFSTQAEITEPSALFINSDVIEQGSITGEPTGAATFTFGGGTPPLKYRLSNSNSFINAGAGATVDFTQLTAGDYTLTVMDENGCMQTETINIYPCDLQVGIETTRPICIGSSDATIDLKVEGNVGTVIYDWDNNQFDGQSSIENLPKGTYRVTIIDEGTACYINRTIEILPSASQPLFIDFDILAQGTNIGAEVGAVNVAFGGGAGPLTYQFSNNTQSVTVAGNGSVNFNELVAGTYTFTLTDANKCTLEKTVEIFPCGLQLNIDVDRVNCIGNNDGAIHLDVSNNQGDLYFDWNEDRFDGQSSIGQLTVGTYTVAITDLSNNCMIEKSIVVTSTNIQVGLSCSTERSDGHSVVDFTIVNGTPPYQAFVTGTNISRTLFFPGDYSLSVVAPSDAELIVRDANGCQSSCILNGTSSTGGCIDFSAIAFYSTTLSTPTLAGVEAIASGGTIPYSYLWSNGQTNSIIKVPYGSELSVEVRDAAGCRQTAEIVIPAAPNDDDGTEEEPIEEEEDEVEEDNSNPTIYHATCVNNCNARGQGETFIDKIKIGHSTLNSGDNEGFRYFSSAFLSFQSEGNYALKLKAVAKSVVVDSLYWYMWIDANNDGDFDDEGEALLSEKSTYDLNGEITFPFLENTRTVCTRFAVSTEPVSACESVTNGEVEDYIFIVNTNRFQPPVLKGEAEQNLIRVAWFPIPDSDEQVERYIIEKSIDNQLFMPIRETESIPTSIHELLDKQPVIGDNYYRLVTFRVGGEVYYSEPILIQYKLDESQTQLFPIPAQRQALLHLPMEKTELVTIKIYNQIGKKMLQQQVQFEPGVLIPLDVSQLANGFYFVQIETIQRKQQIVKMVVEKVD